MNSELLRVKMENQELLNKYSDLINNVHGVEKQLLTREGDCKQTEQERQQFLVEISRLRNEQELKQRENVDLNRDLKMLVGENQKLNETNNQLLAQLNNLQDDV